MQNKIINKIIVKKNPKTQIAARNKNYLFYLNFLLPQIMPWIFGKGSLVKLQHYIKEE